MLCALSLTTARAAQHSPDPVFASDIVDRYANHIYFGSGATGMAIVVIDGNQRVFRSYGETRPGNNVRPQLDSGDSYCLTVEADDQRDAGEVARSGYRASG